MKTFLLTLLLFFTASLLAMKAPDVVFNLNSRTYTPEHYGALGVALNANKETIKKAYRKLIMEHSPDKTGDLSPEGQARAKEINAAWTVLQDDQRRAQYDAERDLAQILAHQEAIRPPHGAGMGGFNVPPAPDPAAGMHRPPPFNFNDFFGGNAGFNHGNPGASWGPSAQPKQPSFTEPDSAVNMFAKIIMAAGLAYLCKPLFMKAYSYFVKPKVAVEGAQKPRTKATV